MMLLARPLAQRRGPRLAIMQRASERDELKLAYEGLEAEFSSRAALERYRAAILERSAAQADFICHQLGLGGPRRRVGCSMLEVACGNGRLLIELARRNCIREARGVDIARSRIEFARNWAAELSLDQLRFEAADVLEMPLGACAYDAIVCLTGAFGYFEPLGAGTAAALLGRWREALVPGGLLILELYPHPELIPILEASGGSACLWRELDPSDPWRFYLSDLRLQGGVLTHMKTFIHRTNGEVDAGRSERLQLYSAAEVSELLEDAGLSGIECHEGWKEAHYAGGESMVVAARAS
jgi:SAM-dependent methyltransferase